MKISRPDPDDRTTPLIETAWKFPQPADYIEVMIKYEADVDGEDRNGDTALIISTYFSDDKSVEILIHNKANIDFCSKNYGTVLHGAAAEGYLSTTRLLLDLGADPTIQGIHTTQYSRMLPALIIRRSWSSFWVKVKTDRPISAMSTAITKAGKPSQPFTLLPLFPMMKF